jgi:membrane-associated phospholipid phosphatase
MTALTSNPLPVDTPVARDINRLRTATAWGPIIQILLIGLVVMGVFHVLDGPINRAVMGSKLAGILEHGLVATVLRAPGNAPLVLITIVGLLAFSRYRWRAAGTMLINVIVAGTVVAIMKGTFGRSRPGKWPGTPEWVFFRGGWYGFFHQTNVSFVSGDAAQAFAWADTLGLMVPALRWPAYAWATVTMLQRMLVGAHWPSDAVGGAVVGVVTVRLVVRILLRFAGPTQDVSAKDD